MFTSWPSCANSSHLFLQDDKHFLNCRHMPWQEVIPLMSPFPMNIQTWKHTLHYKNLIIYKNVCTYRFQHASFLRQSFSSTSQMLGEEIPPSLEIHHCHTLPYISNKTCFMTQRPLLIITCEGQLHRSLVVREFRWLSKYIQLLYTIQWNTLAYYRQQRHL